MEYALWVFTFGYFFQVVATMILILKISKQRSIFGLCWDTQLILLLGSLSRCIWLNSTRLRNLPFAFLELGANVLLLLISLYLCYIFRYTAVHKPYKYFRWYSIVGYCAVLAFCFHPGSKNEYYLSGQMLVSFTMFSECAGLIPQYLVMRKAKEIEGMTGKYIMCLGVARLLRLIFWIQMYLTQEMFLSLILADLIHSLILADFSVVYFKNIKGGKLILP